MGFTQDKKFKIETWYDYIIWYFSSLAAILTVQYVIDYTFYILPVVLFVAVPQLDKKMNERYKSKIEKDNSKKIV